MKIQWIAHACFMLTLDSGTTVLVDPFNEEIGYKLPELSPDILLLSHGHNDHAEAGLVAGNPKVIDKEGEYTVEDVRITAISQPHDHHDGQRRGHTLTFKIVAEDIRLLHAGDLGCIPDEGYIASLGKIDVLMVPVGGVYTLDANEALELIKLIEPNIILPMHYKTAGLVYDIASLRAFKTIANTFIDVATVGGSSMNVSADNLKKRQRIVVLQNIYD